MTPEILTIEQAHRMLLADGWPDDAAYELALAYFSQREAT